MHAINWSDNRRKNGDSSPVSKDNLYKSMPENAVFRERRNLCEAKLLN